MSEQETVLVEINGVPRDIDIEIAPIVKALNDARIATVASCSGHGHRPGNIALADGRELIIAADYDEGRRVDRCFPDIHGTWDHRTIDPETVKLLEELIEYAQYHNDAAIEFHIKQHLKDSKEGVS